MISEKPAAKRIQSGGGDIGFDKEEIAPQVVEDEDLVMEFDPSLQLNVTNI